MSAAVDTSVLASRACAPRDGIWQTARLPPFIAAVMQALQLRGASFDALLNLTETELKAAISWCDSGQATLLLGRSCREVLPPGISEIIAEKYDDYRVRLERITEELARVSDILANAGIPYVVLKGFTHCPELSTDPIARAQGDIDLWCPGESANEAFAALRSAGYQPSLGSKSDRHLPPLATPRQWEWNGKVAEVPVSIEIHHQLWSGDGEGFNIPQTNEIWHRQRLIRFGDREYPALALQDLVGFAAVHFFLHLIHGDLPLQRSWEIGNFLSNHSADASFWTQLRELHSPELIEVQAIVFSLAAAWFNCEVPEWLAGEQLELPEAVRFWLAEYAFEPLRASTDHNKNHLWLRLAMVRSKRQRLRLLWLTFVPGRIPVYEDGLNRGGLAGYAAALLRQRDWLARRTRRHLLAIPPTLAGGARWLLCRTAMDPGFGAFLTANLLYDVGEFLFVVLYGLYLLSLGLREDMIGFVASAMTAGTLVGSPLAALVQRRAGLRSLLLIGALGGGIAGTFRALPLGHAMLLVTAAVNGMLSSFWGVAYAPAVSAVTRQRSRSTAFAMLTALAMSIGVLAGVAAVRVPAWFSAHLHLTALGGRRAALCGSCVLVALAALPAWRLRLDTPTERKQQHVYPRGVFIRTFAAALFLYMFATNSFNTFGLAFLSLRLHLPEREIGSVFSTGQLLQVLTMLSGPLLIRRMGEKRFIFVTSVMTALILLALATGPSWASIWIYLTYLSCQYMGEPSLFALLMNRVTEQERAGASTVMLITMSVAGTAAAALAGIAISRFGYLPSLSIAAILAAIAAVMFNSFPDLAFGLQESNNKHAPPS